MELELGSHPERALAQSHLPPTPPSPLSRHFTTLQNWNPPPTSLCLLQAAAVGKFLYCKVAWRWDVTFMKGSPIRMGPRKFDAISRQPEGRLRNREKETRSKKREEGVAQAWSSEPAEYRPDACRAYLKKEKQYFTRTTRSTRKLTDIPFHCPRARMV